MLRPRHLWLSTLLVAVITLPALGAFEKDFDPNGSGPLHPGTADGRLQDRPTLAATRLAPGEEIVMDGRLDDAVWARAETGFGMVQQEPERRATASVQSVFKIAYDDNALYLAAACFEDDMDLVARRLSRRDNIESSDFVSFYIDPYHDLLSGYNFRVTSDGVKADHYIYNDGNRDPDWEAVWEAETWEDDRGWYLEIRIPFQAIRFKPGSDMTWGMQFYRWLHGRGEDTGWATWDRTEQGFVSRWGTLTGISDVHNPRALEILPYVAGALNNAANPDDQDESWNRYLNWGADFKYNLTSALTAQLTFQPDFGQVEADPATLNLSPFETFYQEKRPFFVEGSRFFQHPNFNLFYSRRIGTGDVNSRIRAAGKLTGKIGGQTTLAVLGAYTDIAPNEQGHNPFISGTNESGYGVIRVARDLDEGNHRLGLMGTVVSRAQTAFIEDESYYRDHRNAVSGGADGRLQFQDKTYAIEGSVVGTVVQPHDNITDPTLPKSDAYGTAAYLSLRKQAGVWRTGINGNLESDRFDPNDAGFLQSNDEISARAYLQYRYDADGQESLLKTSYQYLQFNKSWLYGDQRRVSDTTGEVVWEYGKGHRQWTDIYFDSYNQTHGYWDIGFAAEHWFEGTSKDNTRGYEGQRGPLMTNPAGNYLEGRVQTDWRNDVVHELESEVSWNDAGSNRWELEYGLRWNIGRHLITRLSATYQDRLEDAQWMTNQADDEHGIDGVAYLFGRLDQQIVDMTLRASYLFTRDTSLELYVQPYLTTGSYTDPRYLAEPDSRDLRSYDLEASLYDFNYSAVNLNLVWRYEYRPGSTIYLVWTHGRTTYDERSFHTNPGGFDGELNPSLLFDQEPENTFLAKVNYWFSI